MFGSFDPFLSTTGLEWFVLGFLICDWVWPLGMGMRVGRTGVTFALNLGMAEVGAWASRSMKPKGVQDLLFSHSGDEASCLSYHCHKYIRSLHVPATYEILLILVHVVSVDTRVTHDIVCPGGSMSLPLPNHRMSAVGEFSS
jgi:hypothetical protein